MNDDELEQLSLSELITIVANQRVDHFTVLEVAADQDRLTAEGHLVAAALIRSLALTEGFLSMVEQANRFAAVPLIRMQLDSAMRVLACSLVTDPFDFARHILEGGRPSQYTSRDGVRLFDAFLLDELAKRTPHVRDIYEETSGFVHLSRHHLFGVVDVDKVFSDQKIVFHEYQSIPPWSEADRKSAILLFSWASEVLLDMCKDWRLRV